MPFPLGPAFGGLVEEVEGAEALRVGVFEVLEFVFEEDVGFGDVAEDERYFCGVGGVFEYGARELVHSVVRLGSVVDWGLGGEEGRRGDVRCYSRSTSYQCNVVVLVRLPWVFRYWSLKVQPLSGSHVVQMLAHGPVRIPLYDQINVTFLVLVANRRVWPYDWFLHLRTFILGQKRRRNLQSGDIIFVWKSKAELLGVVVDVFNGFKL